MKTKTNLPKSVLFLSFVLYSLLSFSQWTNIASTANYSFNDIVFPSQSVGFAIVDSSSATYLFKTQDAGVNWENLNLSFAPITGVDIQSVHFADVNTGYIVFRGNDGGMNSYVYKTVDGGLNWTDKTPNNLPLGYGVSDVFFTDLNTGFVGIGEVICRTIDGGNNWTTTTLSSFNSPNEIDFIDNNNGIAGAWDGTFAYQGIIYTTTNGGVSWDSLVLGSAYTVITDVEYTTNNTAYALTDDTWSVNQKIYKTVDNGQIWDTLFLGFLLDSSDAANDMFFINDTEGYLSTEKGYIFKTTDGGMNWNEEHFESPYLDIIAHNGMDLFVGGPISTLITKTSVTAVEEKDYFEQNNSVYPNPISANGIINFETPVSGVLQITDLTGRIIVNQELSNEKQFNLMNKHVLSGIYILTVVGEEMMSEKIIVK